jgi:hypothetical protein
MHLHVGSNTPGYLPEGEVFCFDELDDALAFLREELRSQQSDYYACCTGCRWPDGTGDPCPWCDVAADVEAALSAIADGDAAWHLRRHDIGFTFSPPEGSDGHYWCAHIATAADTCELAEVPVEVAVLGRTRMEDGA